MGTKGYTTYQNNGKWKSARTGGLKYRTKFDKSIQFFTYVAPAKPYGQVVQELVRGQLKSQASDGLPRHGGGIDGNYHRLGERLAFFGRGGVGDGVYLPIA